MNGGTVFYLRKGLPSRIVLVTKYRTYKTCSPVEKYTALNCLRVKRWHAFNSHAWCRQGQLFSVTLLWMICYAVSLTAY